MKPFTERSFKARIPLYDYTVVELVLTSDIRQTEEKRKITEPAQAHTICDNNKITVIMKSVAPVHVIAHEGVHVATHVLFTAGVKADLDNDEPIAYVVDWFAKWAARCVTRASREAQKTIATAHEPKLLDR